MNFLQYPGIDCGKIEHINEVKRIFRDISEYYDNMYLIHQLKHHNLPYDSLQHNANNIYKQFPDWARLFVDKSIYTY